MSRIFVSAALATTAALLVAASGEPAHAESNSTTTDHPGEIAQTGQRLAVPTPRSAFVPHAQISTTLYMERCTGGCTVYKGSINDARSMMSTIPINTQSTIQEYKNGAGESGAAADEEWNLLMQCMREVYSPFNVQVTDEKPAAGVSYHMAIVAGIPQDIGRGNDILGVAPLASDCSPSDNVISFSFANAHPQRELTSRVNNLCWTAAQESAHAFGLDHAFEYQDKRSACNDPMTYRFDCGGQKFFRNEVANCGENAPRACKCGANQNSHLKLLNIFGAGTSLIPAPTVAITTPNASSDAADSLGQNVIATSFSDRGVARVELWLNGYKWAEAQGAAFGPSGQPESPYLLKVPSEIPNSVYDVTVKAYDDLGIMTESEVLTVTKGPMGGCSSADNCLKGQQCEAGRCFWTAPTGELGDDCTYNQFCKSGMCAGTAEQTICTQPCSTSVMATCPADQGLECLGTGAGTAGICFLADEGGGCCSSSQGSTPLAAGAFAMLVLGLLVAPRRRRTA